jgi:hypothetical protein
MATPPVFTSGQILTAAQMNAAGLWLVKKQTIGAQTSVEITNAFTTDFDSYKIIINGGVASTTALISCQLGSTATGYYWSHPFVTYAGVSGVSSASNSGNFGRVGLGTTSVLTGNFDLINPFNAKNTIIHYSFVDARTNGEAGAGGGFLNDTTSYTGFTIASTATMTGGTISVYGYNK